jgi:hypothetical protein
VTSHGAPQRRQRLNSAIRKTFAVLILLAGAMLIYIIVALRDRHPGYQVAVRLDTPSSKTDSAPLHVGFGRIKINPDLSDPEQPIWLAGFDSNRRATGIHDDLWAVACVLDNTHVKMGIVAVDSIGIMHDDVIEVRRRLAGDSNLDYLTVCSTHNHSTPDLIGLWGPTRFQSGINERYRKQVIDAAAEAVGKAFKALQPARVAFHKIQSDPDGLVADTRPPEVFDPDIRFMHFLQSNTEETIGTLINWACHPETVWAENTEITADYPGYLRDALEFGVHLDDTQAAAGVGGTHLYFNGAIGGLITRGGAEPDAVCSLAHDEVGGDASRGRTCRLFVVDG